MIQISYDYETCHNVCVYIYIYISKQSIFLIHPKNKWNIVQPKTKRVQDTINYAIHTGAKPGTDLGFQAGGPEISEKKNFKYRFI